MTIFIKYCQTLGYCFFLLKINMVIRNLPFVIVLGKKINPNGKVEIWIDSLLKGSLKEDCGGLIRFGQNLAITAIVYVEIVCNNV